MLTYTIDLGFFEAFGLGVAQACGARVTVVGDVGMSQPDPRSARRAGRSYLPGQAHCRNAFHPKLVVIAGPKRVTAAIGSGNATLAGWQANAEISTILRGDEESCPAALITLAAWMKQLPAHVRFSWGVPEALSRVAAQIDALLEKTAEYTNEDVRLVSSSAGAIIDQLPNGPVDELGVSAPFHDPGALTLRTLVERLRPNLLRISYQPRFTQLDGPAVAALVDQNNAELRCDTETHYRHGKLIEWSSGGVRQALTGSPNLSGAALLRSLQEGGNCELGVIAPVSASLMPEGGAVPASDVRSNQFVVHRRTGGGPLLLGATRVERGLHVLFAAELARRGYLELSLAAAPPETWERAGNVAVGENEATLTIAADGNSRIRFVTITEDGAPSYSNLVFVVDPAKVSRLPGITAAHTSATRPDELFDDPKLAEKFLADALTLTANQPPRKPRVTATGRRGKAGGLTTRLDDDIDSWQVYLDECVGRIGPHLLRFALGLPVLPPGESVGPDAVPVSWADEMFTDNQVGLQSDTTESAAQEDADPTVTPAALPNPGNMPAAARHRYQRWAEKMTDATGRFSPPEKMLVIRLLLWSAAGGIWDRADHAWIGLMSRALESLGAADLPRQVEPQVGSLVAVAFSVLRAAIPRSAHGEESYALDKAARAVGHLLVETDPSYIEEYTQLLGPAFGAAVHPEIIAAVANDIIQNDPIADAAWALTEMNRNAHRDGPRLLHVVGDFHMPTWVAIEAIGEAQNVSLVGAWASSTTGSWAMCIWQRPNLYIIDHTGPRLNWRHYKLSNLLSPRILAAQRSLEGVPRVSHGPFINSFPEVFSVLEQLGLRSPEPPSCCGSDEIHGS